MADGREPYRAARDALFRANGPAEYFARNEIGDRDGWVCGICQDPGRLADPAAERLDQLVAVVDHVLPPGRGGTRTRDNVQIAHRFCNSQKSDGPTPDPAIMRAKLTRKLHGTPLPEAMYRAETPPAPDKQRRKVQEHLLAEAIERGHVAPSLRSRWRRTTRFLPWSRWPSSRRMTRKRQRSQQLRESFRNSAR
jgi:hypothetical protein